MRKFLSWSIRTQLMIFVSLLALPSLVLIIHSGLAERRTAIQDARKECLRVVNNIASEEQAVVTGVQQLVTALAFLPEVQSRNAQATERILVRLLEQNPQYATIGIGDAAGASWASAIPGEGPLSMAGRRYYDNAVRTGLFSSGEYAIGRRVKKPVVHFGYPVKNASGRLISVIVVALNLPQTVQSLDDNNLPSGASLTLLDHQGTILARSLRGASSQGLVGYTDASRVMFDNMLQGRPEGTFEANGNDGKSRLAAYKRVSLPHEAGPYLYVRLSVPMASVVSRADASMSRDLAVLLAVYLAALALVWFVGEAAVVKPVLKLVRASEQLTGGVARVNVSDVVKGGELGKLAQAFDDMAESLLERKADRDAAEASLALLADTAGDLLQEPDPPKLVGPICTKVMERLGCQVFLNYLTVEGTGGLKLNAFGGIPEEAASQIESVDFRAVFADGADCGGCEGAGCADGADAPLRISDFVRSYGVRAYANNPLLGPDGLVVGSLSFGATGKDAFSDDELSLMKAIAGQVAVAIVRMRGEKAVKKARDGLEERVRERTQDIRRQAELLELAHNAVIVRDPEGRITFWNAKAVEVYGWTKAEAVGSFSHALLDTQLAVPFDQYTTALFDEGRWDGDLVHVTKDGRRITVLSRQALQRDEDGNPMAVLEINLDVTEARRTEQQLRQAQKMEALGTLTGGIAHDFNNILAAIVGFSEMARGRAPEGSRQEHDIGRVVEAALRGRDLVRQMLTFSRSGVHEKEPLRLSDTVGEVMQLLRASIPSTISITVKVESESGLVYADPTQMQQVVMNLCTNAAYAMRETGGILHVTLSDFIVTETSKYADMKPGLYTKLVVRDTGVGMPPDIIDKIFDPFFTTKERGEGTGLGLSVVLGIVRQHEGYITMESEAGQGTEFIVYLPRIEGKLKETAPEEESIPGGSERVLLVDDEELLTDMGRELLEDLGYEVTARNDSVEALALFTSDPSRFDLVITDQTMPDITGIELGKAILAARPDIPVILCTGFSHLVDADSAKAAGINGFVMKPLTKREIALAVRKALDGQP